MKRIVSLWFPHWPIERLRRENPGALPVDAAFALVGERDRGAMVTAVDAGARRAGIAPGHGLADARALLPRLRTVAADSVGDRRALTALAHWANRYGAATALESPVVSPTGEAAAVADGLVIDITGVAHLYGGEAALLRDLLRHEGHAVGRRHVATLMRRMGIEALYRKPSLSRRQPGHQIYPYLLRDLAISWSNHVWAADIT